MHLGFKSIWHHQSECQYIPKFECILSLLVSENLQNIYIFKSVEIDKYFFLFVNSILILAGTLSINVLLRMQFISSRCPFGDYEPCDMSFQLESLE